MVLKAGIADPALLGIPESILPDLREQADLFSREDLLRLFDAFQKIETGMRYATQVRFQLEMGLIELAHIAKLKSLEDLIAEFSASAEGVPPRKPEIPLSAPPMTPAPAPAPAVSIPAKPNPRAAAVETKARSAAPVPDTPPISVPPGPAPAESHGPAADPRNLLFKIAAALGREALESLLQTLEGAYLKDNMVVLQPGSANEFVRRQIKDNLTAISQAATRVIGSKVNVVLGELESRPEANPQTAQTDRVDEPNLLEKAKREPVVKSFLDVFPGPVKAEKIDK
jgi:DNA polymerase III gamma/tau subunit